MCIASGLSLPSLFFDDILYDRNFFQYHQDVQDACAKMIY